MLLLNSNVIFLYKAAFEYLISNPTDPFDVKKFNEYCGVGVVITPEQIKETV